MAESPTLLEVLNDAVDKRLEGVHVAVPGTVISYNRLTQRATVRPAVKKPHTNDDGDITYVEFEVLEDVPVAWPRAGQAAVVGDLVAGDSVELLFHEQGIGEWRAGTNNAEPKDVRRLSFGYPVARPGLYPDTNPLQAPPAGFSTGYQGTGHTGRIEYGTNVVQVGAGAGQAIALKASIDALVTAISTALGTVDVAAGTASKATFDTSASALVYSVIAKAV